VGTRISECKQVPDLQERKEGSQRGEGYMLVGYESESLTATEAKSLSKREREIKGNTRWGCTIF
jgi:hypothetical protein